MYIKYSTRKFKISHLERIKVLKDQYASQGILKTQEGILTELVEEGLKAVETEAALVRIADGNERSIHQAYVDSKKRTAPMGIKDE